MQRLRRGRQVGCNSHKNGRGTPLNGFQSFRYMSALALRHLLDVGNSSLKEAPGKLPSPDASIQKMHKWSCMRAARHVIPNLESF